MQQGRKGDRSKQANSISLCGGSNVFLLVIYKYIQINLIFFLIVLAKVENNKEKILFA